MGLWFFHPWFNRESPFPRENGGNQNPQMKHSDKKGGPPLLQTLNVVNLYMRERD